MSLFITHMPPPHQNQHHKEENMTKKQTRLEKVREKNVEVEEFPKVEENIEESPISNKRTPIVLEKETVVENIPKVEKYTTKTYLVKDVLVGRR